MLQVRDGIYNKFDMVDNIVKCLDGITITGAANVNLLSQAFQMLFALRNGLQDEDNAKNKTIELLKEQLKRSAEPEPGGDVVGGQHYDLKFGGADNGTD